MTFVFLQYPVILLLFLLTAFFLFLAAVLKTGFQFFALFSGASALLLFLAGLFYSVPTEELLALFLLLALLCRAVFPKGGAAP